MRLLATSVKKMLPLGSSTEVPAVKVAGVRPLAVSRVVAVAGWKTNCGPIPTPER
jgi:hypothetical protein